MERPPIPPPTGEVTTYPQVSQKLDVVAVAKAQQLVMISLAVTIGATILQQVAGNAISQSRALGPSAFPVALLAVSLGLTLATTGFRLYSIYVLSKSLQLGWAILAVILSIVPCVGIILLLVLSSQATKILKDAGIGVGLMGAKSADLKEYQAKLGRLPNP